MRYFHGHRNDALAFLEGARNDADARLPRRELAGLKTVRPRKTTHAAGVSGLGRTGAGGYRTREVAALIGLPPERIRGFVRRGLIAPARGAAGEYRFSFQDMVLLRTAKGLLQTDVSSRRAYAALANLKEQIAGQRDEQPLSAMRIFVDGSTVVAQQADALWDAETGQGVFAFAVSQLAGEVRALAQRNLSIARSTEGYDSDDWYNLALDLEDVDPDKAPEAYIRALELNPGNIDAYVNLGRLCQLRGDRERAKLHYQKALAAAPDHQLACYDMGTVFDELGEIDAAISYYRRATEVPDAHHNLARIFELRGDELAARRHMRSYRRLAAERRQ